MPAPEPDGVAWRTSSYSGGSGGCIEVGWHNSSYSGHGDNCIQVAPASERVLVRDSKDPHGPALTVGPDGWRAFLTTALR